MNHIKIFSIILLLACAGSAQDCRAFNTSHYAEQSVLAEGRWMKISVDRSGLYRLPAKTLRQWGFTDLSRVRVYGYGGRRIDDALTTANYVDDLPQVQTTTDSDNSIIFYAAGPESREISRSFERYRLNPYTEAAYYFVTDSDVEPRAIETTATPGATDPATSFTECLHHELDQLSPGECGVLLVGEDFKYTPTRRFRFELPDRTGPMGFEVSFVAKTIGVGSDLQFEVNGQAIEPTSSDAIQATGRDGEKHGRLVRTSHYTNITGNTFDLTITHKSSGIVYNAWLNYIAVNYDRALKLPSDGNLLFGSQSEALRLDGADAATVIWDVTDHRNIRKVDFAVNDGGAEWTSRQGGRREYAAWSSASRLPVPKLVGTVTNQNLHADRDIDMVIFTHPAWLAQAERIAELHRSEPDKYNVKVVDVDEVYNEFSSGAADVSGLRKYLKMLYDRGAGSAHRLKYALLMGRMTYDERHLTEGVRAIGAPTIPAWQQREESLSLDSEQGFATDDFIAMLEDNTGGNKAGDMISIAVGRLPVTSARDARTAVDKIVSYARKARPGVWKNRVIVLADDGDNGDHYNQSEKFSKGVEDNSNSPFVVEKVYLSAHEKTNGVYPEAREQMYRALNEGVAWWTFVGHATNHSWTGDGMLTFNDINNNLYFRNLPFVYASTCNFLRWDSNTRSGGEIMMFEPNGGAVGMISATRPVYITYNGYLTAAMGRYIGRRDSDGRLLSTGEIYRQAKNNMLDKDGNKVSTENRLRYVLMGDPALRLSTPDRIVRIDSVGDIEAGGDDQIIIAARSMSTVKGSVVTPDGNIDAGFNGVVTVDLYDADRTILPIERDSEGRTFETYDTHGDRLYSGSAVVRAGRFELALAMPAEISNNFRETTISMAAYSDDRLTEAAGLDRSCYVFGFDEDAAADSEAPVIEYLALNHPTWTTGGDVNTEPVLLAKVSDNVGINLSSAGVGRQMTVMLDERTSYSDVQFYYTPASDGTPSGEIAYPMPALTEGPHTIRLRVFDTNGNSATKTVDCFVREGIAPTIFDVYSDASPATTEANFYVSHNRPEGMMTVTVTVYNLLGHQLWSETNTGRSDMFTSTPVTWNLTDGSGRRVGRGIYIYKATITADGETYQTASRKIAVTSR